LNDASLEELVDEYYDRLFRAAVFLTSSPPAAEELVQETFMAAGEGLDRFEGRSSYYTWLYGILRNKYYKWVRDQKRNPMSLEHMTGDEDSRRPAGVLEGEEQQPLQNLEKQEAAREVREAVTDLPPHHRDVLLLRFMEGMAYQDIAEEMDCSIGTVKSRIHYALKKVGRRIEPPEGTEGEE
jgi:RNA polymerase sigma-70 factor (ECF subfamily)